MRAAFVLVVVSTLAIYVEAVRIQQKGGFTPVDLPKDESTKDKFKNLSYPSDAEIWDTDIEKDCIACKKQKKKKTSRQTQDATTQPEVEPEPLPLPKPQKRQPVDTANDGTNR